MARNCTRFVDAEKVNEGGFMIRIKSIKRKNPTNDILDSLKPYEKIKTEHISEGGAGETYVFKTKMSKILENGIILKPNTYLIKRYFVRPTFKEIEGLVKLSKYGLIPKIYYIDKNYCIMQYIQGHTLANLINKNMLNLSKLKLIFDKIRNILSKWHKLGFYHGDLKFSNIIITDNNNVHLIDPLKINEYFDDIDYINIREYNIIDALIREKRI